MCYSIKVELICNSYWRNFALVLINNSNSLTLIFIIEVIVDEFEGLVNIISRTIIYSMLFSSFNSSSRILTRPVFFRMLHLLWQLQTSARRKKKAENNSHICMDAIKQRTNLKLISSIFKSISRSWKTCSHADGPK